ncbi:hypothetical protein Tco_1144265 [Tanacetum coccineum]
MKSFRYQPARTFRQRQEVTGGGSSSPQWPCGVSRCAGASDVRGRMGSSAMQSHDAHAEPPSAIVPALRFTYKVCVDVSESWRDDGRYPEYDKNHTRNSVHLSQCSTDCAWQSEGASSSLIGFSLYLCVYSDLCMSIVRDVRRNRKVSGWAMDYTHRGSTLSTLNSSFGSTIVDPKLMEVDSGTAARYIASDCDAIAIMHDVQGYSKLPEDVVAVILKQVMFGLSFCSNIIRMDVKCGSYLKKYTKSEVQMNKITEADIDRALVNLFTIRMKLGGRLPVTCYPKEFKNLEMTDMRMRPDPSYGYPGRTYRFYNGKTVFDFGYGLGTQLFLQVSFKSPNQGLSASRQMLVSGAESIVCEKVKFTMVVGIDNHGQASNHTVLLFAKWNGKDLMDM